MSSASLDTAASSPSTEQARRIRCVLAREQVRRDLDGFGLHMDTASESPARCSRERDAHAVPASSNCDPTASPRQQRKNH